MGVTTFNLLQALNGALVTVEDHETEYTGRLKREGKDLSQLVVYMAGSRLVVNDEGKVLSCIPALTGVTEGTTYLKIYTDSTTDDMHYKSRGYIPSEHQETGYTSEVELRNMQMRDHFALAALGVIMQRLDHPEAADDETCLHYSRVAYRWATGMMQAALASREGVKVPDEDQSEEKTLVEVATSELATSTEKLLYNIAATLENIKKQDQDHYDDTHTEDNELKVNIAALEDMMTQDNELKVNVTDIADIDINSMPEVVIDGTPDVHVTNTPSVLVSGTPDVHVTNTPSVSVSGTPNVNVSNTPNVRVSNTVAVSGTVSVDNFPQSSNNSNE